MLRMARIGADNGNWLSDAPKWHGVNIDSNGRGSIRLNGNPGLTWRDTGGVGQPRQLAAFGYRRSWDLALWGNELTGAIPAELGNLANLQRLDLSCNELTDAIPAELGNLANLQELYLGGNELTGAIPAELGNLANLQRVGPRAATELTGAIPAELGNLANLEELYLSGNQLTGAIPAELGNLANLERLYLSGNQLTGCIPVALRMFLEHDLSGR